MHFLVQSLLPKSLIGFILFILDNEFDISHSDFSLGKVAIP